MGSDSTILILCTGNSCRSIMAEAILRQQAGDRLRVVSAGSHPKGSVDAGALAVLRRHGIDVGGLRSKSWDEWAGMPIALVITVCDDAAGEACPLFAGEAAKAHLGMRDPSRVTGSPAEIAASYEAAYRLLDRRMKALLALGPGQMEPKELQSRVSSLATLYPEETCLQSG